MQFRHLVTVTAAVAGSLFFTALWAAEAEDLIKYRQAVMKSVGGHMGAAAQIVRGKVPYAADLVHHAESIKKSLEDVPKLFPPDSDFGETSALPAVWSKADGFRQKADEAKVAADEFLEASKGGDQAVTGAKFKGLVDTCKACHKDFREEE